MARYEVQTHTMCDGWINCWTETDEDDVETLQTFETYEEAEATIYEFFADLARAGMASMYDLGDYRIVEVLHG